MSEFQTGVFFGMPDETYRQINALNASGMKWLIASPLDYWARSPMNQDREAVQAEEGDSEARIIGRAFHKRILEGKPAFDGCYAQKIDAADYPAALRTLEDLKARGRELDVNVSGSKDLVISRLLEKDPELRGQILDCVQDDYAEAHVGKTFLSFKWMKKIAIASQMIEADPQISKVFSGGAPEVSVIWMCPTIGVPCKSRVDYVKSRAVGELKTFSNVIGLPLSLAAAREFRSRKYALQAQFELEAVSHIAKFIEEGKVFGDCDLTLLRGLGADHPKTQVTVMQCKGIAPAVLARKFTPDFVANSMTFQTARAEIEAHKQTYRTYFEKFGTDPWVTPQTIEDFADEEIQTRVWT